MQTLFGFELSTGLRWIIAFAIVLVLVALFAFLLRRITGGRLRFKGQGSGRTRQPRLGVVDIHDLDRQRQLILVRRDNVEHLVMIGGASDVVIETNIMRSGARVAAPLPSEGAPERPLALEPLTLPELPLRGESAEEPRRAPPLPEAVPVPPMPAPPAPPLRQQQPLSPPSQPPLPPVRPAGQAMPPARPAPPPAATPAAAAAAAAASAAVAQSARETVAAGQAELGDMARQLEEALKRPFSAVRSSGGARPETEAVKPPATPVPPPAAPVPPAAPPVPANQPKPPPTLSGGIPASSRPPLDMEAELEMALGLKPGPARPAEAPMVVPPVFAAPERKPQPAPARPEPARPEPTKLEPAKPEPAKTEASKPEPARNEPAGKEPETAARSREVPVPSVEAVHGAEPKRDEPRSGEPKPDAPKPVAPKPAEPSAEPKGSEAKPEKSKAEQPGSDEAKPAEAKQAEAKPAEVKPAGAKPAEPKPSEADPFSVDAIEAEFARLLGRDPKPKG